MDSGLETEAILESLDMKNGDVSNQERQVKVRKINAELAKLQAPVLKHLQCMPVWQDHVSILTIFVASSLVSVMVACTALRTHLFIWTVFSPKYLYAMAWSIGWHWIVTLGVGGLLHVLERPTISEY